MILTRMPRTFMQLAAFRFIKRLARKDNIAADCFNFPQLISSKRMLFGTQIEPGIYFRGFVFHLIVPV